MNKLDYFLTCMKAGLYKHKTWPISVFSLVREDPNAWKIEPTPYRLVQTQTGYFYVDPENLEKLLPIEKVDPSQPLFKFNEHLDIKIGDIPNLKKNINTTTGNLFFNYV